MALVVKNPPANARDVRDAGSFPGSGRSPGEGYSSPLQCSCLENPMERGAWQAIVHRVAQSRTPLKRLSTHALGRSGNPSGFLVVTRCLSCSKPCGILVPQPGIQSMSPALQTRFLTTGSPGKSQVYFFAAVLNFSFPSRTDCGCDSVGSATDSCCELCHHDPEKK